MGERVSLESVFVMSASGLVLFRRDFHPPAASSSTSAPPSPSTASTSSSAPSPSAASAASSSSALHAHSNIHASVLATLVDVSLKTTGLPLSFLLFTSKAIAIASAPGIVLALFFSAQSFPALGNDSLLLFRSFASGLVSAFLATFTALFPTQHTGGVVSAKEFEPFSARIPDALRTSARQILHELASDQAVANCILVEKETVLHSTNPVEALALVANLQVLLSTTSDLLNLHKDSRSSGTYIDGAKYHLLISPVGLFHLIVAVKRSAAYSVIQPKISASVSFLAIVSESISNSHWK